MPLGDAPADFPFLMIWQADFSGSRMINAFRMASRAYGRDPPPLSTKGDHRRLGVVRCPPSRSDGARLSMDSHVG
jgi:hypothetical protein